MYIVKQNEDYYLVESEDDLNRWASDSLDVDDNGGSFDGCSYMKFEFKPTGKIKILPAEPRRFWLFANRMKKKLK